MVMAPPGRGTSTSGTLQKGTARLPCHMAALPGLTGPSPMPACSRAVRAPGPGRCPCSPGHRLRPRGPGARKAAMGVAGGVEPAGEERAGCPIVRAPGLPGWRSRNLRFRLPRLGRLLGHQPHIVDDLIEPGIGARRPVRTGRLDHPQSQRARHDVEGRLPIDGRGNPAEPVHDPPVDREEPLALRRQEGIQAGHLKRPWPLLLQHRRDARLARTTRAVQNDARCCHSARMPEGPSGACSRGAALAAPALAMTYLVEASSPQYRNQPRTSSRYPPLRLLVTVVIPAPYSRL